MKFIANKELSRALEKGGGHTMPPPVFREYLKKKRRRAAPPNLRYLHTNQEYTLCANFDFSFQKVRSPGFLSFSVVFFSVVFCYGAFFYVTKHETQLMN